MKTKLFLIGRLLLVVLVATACGRQPAVTLPEADPTISVARPVEDIVSLVGALTAAGATIEMREPVEQAFFTERGQILEVNGADVQVFEYETAQAMEADAALVEPDGGSIGTSMVTWMATPHFFKSGRILVLYVGDDQAVVDLLEGALGPQFAGR